MTPFEETVRTQRRAADPKRSAFVAANAGAGKTRVLINRAARLLLANTPPQRILCITFTKSAAAEMADRLFATLGEWALAGDDALTAALEELEGEAAIPRDAGGLAEARRLFARALETPGGLKIQTIHAFCEQVLKRFPLEAGAPPGFSVIEDAEANRLREAALDAIAENAAREETLAADFARLAAARSERDLRALILSGVKDRLKFEAMRARFGGVEGAVAALAMELGVGPDTNEERVRSDFITPLDDADLKRAQIALAASGGDPAKTCAPPLETYLQAGDVGTRWAALSKLFLTESGSRRARMATNATDSIDPAARPFLIDLQTKFIAANDAAKAIGVYRDSAAWLRLVAAAQGAYAEFKTARAALDFDDLILGAESLFKNTANDWVMYKLDRGVDHVLVDEAQDTSPAQWEIIEALLKDRLAGEGAPPPDDGRAPRSFFAVGDMKQSIYSFQGADAQLFEEKEADLGKKLGAVSNYNSYELQLSFRSTAPVLEFVDQLFIEPGAGDGFGQGGVPAHAAKREGAAGLVEIWPLAPRSDRPKPNPWDAPVDMPEADHPARVLAARVAATISDWLARGETLESQDREITAGDIIVLVQTRSLIFNEVIRALGRKGVRVAGADRLKLIEDPAVEDLLSYARFAAFSRDDLALAEILKSPLFGFDDDADLYPLAHGRGEGQSLWAALARRAGENEKWRAAFDEITRARAIGLKDGPYAFLAHILETGARSGRKRFYQRLTEASRDAVDEMLRQALDFEAKHPRSIGAFADWFAKNAGEIKREMERAGDAVRVMTVHAAKGLEANIVFLIDADRRANVKAPGPVLTPPRDASAPGREKLSVLVGEVKAHVPLTEDAREEAKRKAFEEYRRLFYVAATRARDRLYVCGIERGDEKKPRARNAGEKSWHALALDAFDRLGARVETLDAPFWEGSDERARRLSCAQTAAIEEKPQPEAPPPAATPPWLFVPARRETPPLRLAPSRLAGEDEAPADRPSEAAALSPTSGNRYFRGRTLHRLLELLPDIAPDRRRAAGDRLLARLAPEIDAATRDLWRDEALTVINDPQFADAFAPGSRAEVAIAGAPRGGRANLTLSGQIDRLVIRDKDILAVDYKTNRPPPKTIKEISSAYVAQMAAYRALLQEIYPRHEIRAALLWTFEARLTPLPSAMLDHAFARYVAAG